MAAMTNALLLILFALLGSGTAIDDKQANIPARQLNNGTSKTSASYVMSVQYSHGGSPHPAPERPSQNSAVNSSNSGTPMRTSSPLPNIKTFPVRKATNPVVVTNAKTSPTLKAAAKANLSPANAPANPAAIAKVEVSSAQRAENPVTAPNMQTLSSSTRKTTNPVAVRTKQTVTQVQQSAVHKPISQQTVVSEVTYPDSFIAAQIAAASLTTPSPHTYVKPAMLQQQTAASSYSSWHIQPQTTIDRSYSVVNPVKPAALPQKNSGWQLQPEPHTHMSYTALNPAYAKSDILQQPTSNSGWQLPETKSPIDTAYSAMNPAYANSVSLQPTATSPINWHLQLQMPIDRAYSSVNPMRYYPHNTLRQSTLVQPYIDKRNHKYKQYSLSRHPSQHLHGSYPVHSVYAHPHDNYYNRRPPVDRESPPFFKPYPTKYVNFPPNRFPTPYNGLLNFSRNRPSYKDNPFSSGSSGSMYYKILFPLALLGISIPALGMMYTYLSKRRRRRSVDDLLPSSDDIEYYMQILQKAVETYQENKGSSHDKNS